MLLGVIADTHMTGGTTKGRRKLPPACVDRLAGCRMIIHAGDVMTEEAIAEIEAIGPPVEAVLGNVDSFALRGRLPHGVWRRAHVLTLVVWLGATVHLLLAGTDRSDPWLLGLVASGVTAVCLVSAPRVARVAAAGNTA